MLLIRQSAAPKIVARYFMFVMSLLDYFELYAFCRNHRADLNNCNGTVSSSNIVFYILLREYAISKFNMVTTFNSSELTNLHSRPL